MAKTRYYVYDSESCSFVERDDTGRRFRWQVASILVIALGLTALLTWGLDRIVQTPQELALETENATLQRQLADLDRRMDAMSGDLAQLSEVDQELYRSLLQAKPISDDVRQAGVGGSDPYTEFDGFSASAATLLRSTSRHIDRLERQLGMQRDSYRELETLAGEHELELAQLPAILPANGPIVSGFGMRNHPILKIRRPHYGLDISLDRGTPVYAPGDATVLDVDRGNGFGYFVKLEHTAAGYVTLFGHLSGYAEGLQEGQKVKRGDVIAYSGNSGLSAAPHLHYEVRDMQGRQLNPVFFFAPSMTPAAYEELVRQSEQSSVSLD